jgi:hypothetical protein
MTNDSLYPLSGPGKHAPSLPYAGTSGYSGTEASEERARSRDANGRTATLQARVEDYISLGFGIGRTIAEIRDRFPTEHHGSLSGALTALHKAGRIQRLALQRGRCSVYVLPDYVMDRETVPPKQRGQRDEALDAAINRVKDYLDGRSENPTLQDRPVIASSWRKDSDTYNNLWAEDLYLMLKALR